MYSDTALVWKGIKLIVLLLEYVYRKNLKGESRGKIITSLQEANLYINIKWTTLSYILENHLYIGDFKNMYLKHLCPLKHGFLFTVFAGLEETKWILKVMSRI